MPMSKERSVTVHMTWKLGKGVIQVDPQPLFAHLPWHSLPNEQKPSRANAVCTGSIAGRAAKFSCIANLQASRPFAGAMSAAVHELVRPPIVVRAKVAGADAVEVRFFRLCQALRFKDGRYVGEAWVDSQIPPVTLTMKAAGINANGQQAKAAPSKVYECVPVDAIELAQRLAAAAVKPKAAGGRLVADPAVALLTSRPPLRLLQGDAAAGNADKPGIGEAYSVLRLGPPLADLSTPQSRAPSLAWIHTDEYYWKENGKGPLAPVFPSADVAEVFASNLAPRIGARCRGGALLGRFARQAPKQGAHCGWIDDSADCRKIAPNVLPELDEKLAAKVDTPWQGASGDQKHELAILKPSARQVLFTAGLTAIRAEVWATPVAMPVDGKPDAGALPQIAVVVGHFDFLVRDPADVLAAVVHSNGDEIGLGRMDALPYSKWVSIPAWLQAMADDRVAVRAPWAIGMPPPPEAEGTATATTAKGTRAARKAKSVDGKPLVPILCLLSCSGAKSAKQTSSLLDYTEPRPLASGGAAAFLAIFATNYSRPVYQIGLPLGGTVAIVGAQAAVAGRAIGAILTEIQGGRAIPGVFNGANAAKGPMRDTNNAMITRALQLYSFWTAVLGDGQFGYDAAGQAVMPRASVGVVYSIWGVVNPGIGPGAEGFLSRAPMRTALLPKPADAANYEPEAPIDKMSAANWRATVAWWELQLQGLFAARHTYFTEYFSAGKQEITKDQSNYFRLRTGFSSDLDI